MPPYLTSPIGSTPVGLLQPGLSAYCFGSRASGPTRRMFVNKTGTAGGTATITVQMLEGNIPAVGDLITISATQNQAGAFNVTNASITAVNINPTTGAGTIQFALGGATAATGDAGYAVVPVPEIGETLTAPTASQTFAVQEKSGHTVNALTVTWTTAYPIAPTGVSVALQGSLEDIDAQYGTLDSSTNINGETRVVVGVRFRFLRLKVTTAQGTATIIGKILI